MEIFENGALRLGVAERLLRGLRNPVLSKALWRCQQRGNATGELNRTGNGEVMKLNKKQQKAAIKYELLQMNFKSIANEMQQIYR